MAAKGSTRNATDQRSKQPCLLLAGLQGGGVFWWAQVLFQKIPVMGSVPGTVSVQTFPTPQISGIWNLDGTQGRVEKVPKVSSTNPPHLLPQM